MRTTNLNSIVSWVGVLCALAGFGTNLNAQTVRLHGATSLEKLFAAQKAALESQSGVKLEIVGNGAGRGLADLSSGQADIAMIAGPLTGVAEAMNKEKPGSVDASGLKEFPLTSVKLAFITHPSVGVKSLTEVQTRELLSGKITNWKDAGGADLAVKVVVPFAGDGSRITLQENLLKNAVFTPTAILRNSAKDIALVVSQVPGACAFISVKNVEGNVTTVTTEKEIPMPLLLAVKGEPSGDVKKVLDAAKALIK
jgi:phosphate transport system substrate-binding protein